MICLSVCLCLCQQSYVDRVCAVHLSVCLFVCLSVCLSLSPSLSGGRGLHQQGASIFLSVCLSVQSVSVCLSVSSVSLFCFSVCLSILSVCLSLSPSPRSSLCFSLSLFLLFSCWFFVFFIYYVSLFLFSPLAVFSSFTLQQSKRGLHQYLRGAAAQRISTVAAEQNLSVFRAVRPHQPIRAQHVRRAVRMRLPGGREQRNLRSRKRSVPVSPRGFAVIKDLCCLFVADVFEGSHPGFFSGKDHVWSQTENYVAKRLQAVGMSLLNGSVSSV